ncbi:MAG: hypothetical protein LQ352_007332, partial [Teloschistes flavicans]
MPDSMTAPIQYTEAQRCFWRENLATNTSIITQELLDQVLEVQTCYDLTRFGPHNLPQNSHLASELQLATRLLPILWYVGVIQEKFDEWMVDEGKPLVSKALALIAKVRYTSIIHQATNILQLESESNEEWSLFVAVTSTLFAKSGHIQRLTSYLEQTAPQDTTLDLILDDILGLDTYLSMAIQDYSKAGS